MSEIFGNFIGGAFSVYLCSTQMSLDFSYSMATGSIEDRSLFKKFSFHYAVFDEGHLLKNMSSLRYQNLMRINVSRIIG